MNTLLFKMNRKYMKEYAILATSLIIAMSLYGSTVSLEGFVPHLFVTSSSSNFVHSLLVANQIFLFVVLSIFTSLIYPFFLKEETKDLQVFIILGKKRGSLFKKLFLQQFFFLISAFFSGTILSVFLGKFLGQFLVHLISIKVVVPFMFSFSMIKGTFFLSIWLFLIMTIELLYYVYGFLFRERTEKIKKMHYWFPPTFYFIVNIITFGFFVLTFSFSTEFLILNRKYQLFKDGTLWLLIAFFLGIMSVFLFYRETLPFLIKKISQSHFFKKKKKLFSLFSDGPTLLKKEFMVYGMVTLLAAMSFTLMGGAYLFSSEAHRTAEDALQIDFQVAKESEKELLKLIKKNNLPLEKKTHTLYKVEVGNLPYHFSNDEKWKDSFGAFNFISYKDYQELQSLTANKKSIPQELKTGEGLFLQESQEMFEDYIEQSLTLYLKNKKIKLTRENGTFLGPKNLRYNIPTIVLSNDDFEEIEGHSFEMTEIKLATKKLSSETIKKRQEEIEKDFTLQWLGKIYLKKDDQNHLVVTNENQKENVETLQRVNIENYYFSNKSKKVIEGMMLFFAIYTGVIFVLTTGSLFMIHQLQLAKANQKTYQLFVLLGMKESVIKKQVTRELRLHFGFPIVIGLLISYNLMRFLLTIFPKIVWVQSFTLISISLLGFYWIFYRITNYHYYRWLKK